MIKKVLVAVFTVIGLAFCIPILLAALGVSAGLVAGLLACPHIVIGILIVLAVISIPGFIIGLIVKKK